jgi:predicted RNase H-like HicB family nuclease
MEHVIRVTVEKLPEGVYLATSDDVQGLVVQGDTLAATLELARQVAREIMELRREDGDGVTYPAPAMRQEFSVVVSS